MAEVPNGVEKLPKISTGRVGRTIVTNDRQTTDGRTTAYLFTFTNNSCIPGCVGIITKLAVWSFKINQLGKNHQFGANPDYWSRPDLTIHMQQLCLIKLT